MEVNFYKDETLRNELLKWHKSLEDNRGVRAHFRRAKSENDMVFIPEFHHACQSFTDWFDNKEIRLAAILGLISHVKEHKNNGGLAAAMAISVNDRPLVGQLRFKRLLQLDRSSLYVPMIRILKLLNTKTEINICDLAQSIYYWGDKIKRKWAFDYFPKI